MNLAAGSNLNPASKLVIAGRRLSGLAVVLVAIFSCGIYQAQVGASAQNGQCFCEAFGAGVQYETELTGFAEIDAPGRKTSSTRVIKNHRANEHSICGGHEVRRGLPQYLLVLKSPLALPIADSRPSLQDFSVRLQT